MIARSQFLCKTAFLLTCCAIFTTAVIPVNAEPNPETTLLRVEVQQQNGETVKVSVPMGILDSLYSAMPKEIHEACVQLELTPELIYKELSTMQGEDLVRITGEDQVRVWFENIAPESQKDTNFVTVFVKEKEEGGDEIHVKVPKGLVKLAARVIKELGLVDEFVKLPPEIRQSLKKITDKQDKSESKENSKISENSSSEEKKEEPKSE
jgi:hypothetical protein